MTYIDDSKSYIQYAKDIIEYKIISGEYIKLACKRFLDWFERNDIFFDYDEVDRRIRFIEKMKTTQNKPMELLDWQKFCVAGIFGWKYVDDPEQRVINNVLLLISRKNGKTFFGTALALSCALLDGEHSPEVYFIANSSQQASIAMNHAKVQSHSLDRQEKLLKLYRNEIKIPKINGTIKVLSSDTSKLDGLSPSTFIADEIHEYRSWETWNILKTGAGARKNSLAIGVTTTGFHIGDQYPCYNMWTNCLEILRGVKEDDTWFAALYQMDEEDDWKEEKNWIKASPSLGKTVSIKYMREQIRSAINNSSLEVSVRTKNLNQWMQSSIVWLKEDTLLKSARNVDVKDFENETTYIGIDLSSVGDLTAWTLLFPPNQYRELYPDKYVFKTFIYIPEQALEDSPNKEWYKEWIRTGAAIKTSGNVVDYDFILNDMIRNTKNLTLYEVAYDQYNATQFAINATNEGLPLVPYSQSLANFNIPTKSFERLILSGKVVLDNNSCVMWMFRNVELKFDHAENCKPYKANKDATKKIDGVISTLESLGAFLKSTTFDPRIYTI